MSLEAKSANFTPTKRFFVEMLTRDIDLEDAILDLLDNCLDGVARSQKKDPGQIDYNGYRVSINFNSTIFSITDNCGGIPLDKVEYAFRMGKPNNAPEENLATVGVYGIGMKRSIFKIGRHCEITTQHSEDEGFSVVIDEDWLQSDQNWSIPLQQALLSSDEFGTTIEITKLQNQIAEQFKNKQFFTGLENKIIYAYSYIIDKGFEVSINGQKVNPMPVIMRYEDNNDGDGKSIQPYIYTGIIDDDVEVKLIVGFYSPLPSESEKEESKQQPRYESKNAGWTIVCNDRIVVYRDKTELTGWGIELPVFHTQFTAISGIVYFKSNKPEKLPITTTKRGVDITSPVFLKVRKHMVEGTKLFIDYTNKWKGEELIKASNSRLNSSSSASPLEVIKKFETSDSSEINDKWSNVRNRLNEKKFKPTLPTPKNVTTRKNISFSKELIDVELVADYLNISEGNTFNQIGEAAFDYVLREAKR